MAKGSSQIQGIDFAHTHAGLARLESTQVVLAPAAAFDRELDQVDAVLAFFNAKLDEGIYVQVLEDYDEYGEEDKPMLGKLSPSLYGLEEGVAQLGQAPAGVPEAEGVQAVSGGPWQVRAGQHRRP